MLGYAMNHLFAAGARDVFYTPIYMKKNRPAYMLTVICDNYKIEEMEEIIFSETTTIGIRKYPVYRTVMERRKATANTVFGKVELKVVERNGEVFRYPEYESVKAVAEWCNVPFKLVYQAACSGELE